MAITSAETIVRDTAPYERHVAVELIANVNPSMPTKEVPMRMPTLSRTVQGALTNKGRTDHARAKRASASVIH